MSPGASFFRKEWAEAAQRFRPETVKPFLVVEAPPSDLERYFYFDDVSTQASLFRDITKNLFGVQPSRDKLSLLARLQESGVFLIDPQARAY